MPRSRRRARAGPYARRAVPLEGCSGTPAASIEHRRPRLAYETGPATVQVVSLLPPQHDHCTSAPCKRACSAPRMSSRGKFEHANALSAVVGSPRHVWTRTRRRGSGTDTGTPARLSWHRKPSSPGPSGAHLRCRDSARPRDVCEPAAGTACARRAPGSELWDRLTHPRPRCPHESPCARTVAALWPTELHAPRHRRRFRVSFSPSHEKWRPLPESAGRIGPNGS